MFCSMMMKWRINLFRISKMDLVLMLQHVCSTKYVKPTNSKHNFIEISDGIVMTVAKYILANMYLAIKYGNIRKTVIMAYIPRIPASSSYPPFKANIHFLQIQFCK